MRISDWSSDVCSSDLGVDAGTRERLDRFADALGLAFQVRDDLLDVEGDSATLGKTAGKDAEQDKATFPALIGVQASHERLRALGQAMDQARSEEHTSELQSLMRISYAVFCLKKKK